jgi:hypothetical protein
MCHSAQEIQLPGPLLFGYTCLMNLHTSTALLRIGIILLLVVAQTASAKSKKFNIDEFRKQVKNNEVVYTASNGNEIREMEMPHAFIQKEYDKSGVIFFKEFNKEGKLQREGKYAKVAKQELAIGEWKTFDSKGRVTEIKNHEEGFQVTFDQIIEICQQRKIDLTDRLSSLTKSKPGERPMWVIGWNSLPPRSDKVSQNDRSPTTKMEVIVVDGVTGDIKESTPYVPFKN